MGRFADEAKRFLKPEFGRAAI